MLTEQLPAIAKAISARTIDLTGDIGGSISDVFPASDGPKALQQATQALSYCFFLGKDAFVTIAHTKAYSAEPLEQTNALKKRLQEALERRSMDECLATLQAFHNMFRFGAPADIPIIEKTCLAILQLLGEHFNSESVSQLLHMQLAFPRVSYTLDEWFSHLETCYCAVFDLLAHGSQPKNNQLVHAMKTLAQQYYTDVNLSMSWIAEKMERNPNYLSHVFSSSERTSFTDYIASLRIEHARELLLSTNLASYEIAEQSGFTNYRYFSQVFKKLVGTTPSQYRNDH